MHKKLRTITEDSAKQAVTAEVQTNKPTAMDSTTKAFQFITDYIECMVFCAK